MGEGVCREAQQANSRWGMTRSWCQIILVHPLSRDMGFDPDVFGRFDLAALVQPHLQFLFVCLFAVATP